MHDYRGELASSPGLWEGEGLGLAPLEGLGTRLWVSLGGGGGTGYYPLHALYASDTVYRLGTEKEPNLI